MAVQDRLPFMKLRTYLLLTTALLLTVWHVAARQTSGGRLYEPLTFTVDVASELYTNPFDSNDIEVLGIFESPSGQRIVVSGFWIQPYDDVFEPDGTPIWQVRFTPQEVGNWRYSLQVYDNGSLVDVSDGDFQVADSNADGFIRIGENDRYFQFSNGQPYFPVGQNLNWSWDAGGGIETYLRWLADLHAAGSNYARLIIDIPWFIHLEWSGPAGDYRASQLQAAHLDAVLAAAAEYNVKLQLVLLWHQSMLISNGPPVLIPEYPPRPTMTMDWDDHPYNILNGGPLNGPGVFLYDETAKALFQQRLRYIVARWGYSPQIFAWELVDRIDRVSNYTPETARAWLQEMAGYLRRIDPHRHLITVGSQSFDPSISASPYINFISAQLYQRRPIETNFDQVIGVLASIRQNQALNPIPVLLTDFSLNPWFEPVADDPTGVHFQNTIWTAALSGSAGGAMSDWWDTYIFPRGLEQYYAPLSAFTAGIDWANLDLQTAEAGLIVSDASSYQPVRLNNFDRSFIAPTRDVSWHVINADGVYPPLNIVPSYLYGQVFNSQLSQAQLYRVTLPVDGYLTLGIRSVSTQAGARLIVTVDNQSAVELDLRAGTREASARIPMRAGEHQIVLDNMGEDWLELDYLEFDQLVAPARALTLRDTTAGIALSWFQHRGYTWEQAADHVSRVPVSLRYQLNRMPEGRYIVEIWDPLGGGVLGEEVVDVSTDGLLEVDLIPFDRMLALRAFHQEDSPGSIAPEPAEEADWEVPTTTQTALPTATFALEPSPTFTRVPLVPQTNTPRPMLTNDE